MGGHVLLCPKCGHIVIKYNSCRRRFCPQCAGMITNEWLEKQKQRLLDVSHFHIIFTIPEEINPLWLKNNYRMANLLFKAVDKSLEYFLKDPRWLGAKPGKIMVLQTWDSKLNLHPHIHVLLTAGGIDENNNWIDITRNTVLPVKPLMNVFRAKFISIIRQNIFSGKIEYPLGEDSVSLDKTLSDLFFKNWNVFALPKYPQGCGVTQYLASYIRGTPVKDKHILYYDDQMLVLSCRDKRIHDGIEKKGKITLTINQFLQRLLLHFPPYQLRLVRYYGIYHPKNCNILKRLQLLFNKQPDINFESSNYSFDKLTPEELRCPNCGTIRNFLKDLKPDELLAYENILSGKDPPKAA